MAPSLGLVRRFVLNPRLSFATQRARQEKLMRVLARVPRGIRTEKVVLGGVDVLRVQARGARSDRRVVHLHGGAFCIGTSTMSRAFAAALSRDAGVVVLVPEFRLAPEHPFPAALEDTLSVCAALEDDGGLPLALTGDSAGGALAVAATLRLREDGRPAPAALGLVCPLFEVTGKRDRHPPDRVLSPEWLAQCAEAYVGDADPTDPLVSPVHAHLGGLPPTLVVSATHDMLTVDAVRFTDVARRAGVAVEHVEEQGLWHDYALQAGTLKAADEAVARVARHLDEAWGGPG